MRETDPAPIGAWVKPGDDPSDGVVYFHRRDSVLDDEDLHVFGLPGAYRWEPNGPNIEIFFVDGTFAEVVLDVSGDSRANFSSERGEVLLERVVPCILGCEKRD